MKRTIAVILGAWIATCGTVHAQMPFVSRQGAFRPQPTPWATPGTASRCLCVDAGSDSSASIAGIVSGDLACSACVDPNEWVPCGADTQIMYNKADVCGAEAAFAYDPNSNTLSVEDATLSGVLTLSGDQIETIKTDTAVDDTSYIVMQGAGTSVGGFVGMGTGATSVGWVMAQYGGAFDPNYAVWMFDDGTDGYIATAKGDIKLWPNGENVDVVGASATLTVANISTDCTECITDENVADDVLAGDLSCTNCVDPNAELDAGADDTILVSDGTDWTVTSVADCDTYGDALNYDTTTNAFSCGSQNVFGRFVGNSGTSVVGDPNDTLVLLGDGTIDVTCGELYEGADLCNITIDEVGDIESVTAGVGLSGGGSSGDVTLTFAPDELETAQLTWGGGAAASIVETYDVSGTDTTITHGNALTTFSGAVTVTTDLTVTGGDITGANSEAIDIGEATDNYITFTASGAGGISMGSNIDKILKGGSLTIDAYSGATSTISLLNSYAGQVADVAIDGACTLGASPAANDNDTSVATTAYVQGEIDGAGGAGIACSSGSCATASGETNFIASSTSAGGTGTGVLHLDTNGTSVAIPQFTIGDGSNALPVRTCWQMTAGGAGGTTTTYWAMGTSSTTREAVKAWSGVSMVFSNLQCALWKDAPDTKTFQFVIATATISACTVAGDGLTTSCTWSDSALDQTVTGTGASGEYVSATDTSVVTIAPTQFWQLKTVDTGGNWFSCSWMACVTAAW
jgi:hypothetical protein